MIAMTSVKEHLHLASEFYDLGIKELEVARRLNNKPQIMEACDKIFHAYVEASNGLIQKRGFPEPESHQDRLMSLEKLREKDLIQTGDQAFLYLHNYAGYRGYFRPEIDTVVKKVYDSIVYV